MTPPLPEIVYNTHLIENIIGCLRRSSYQLSNLARFGCELRNVPDVQETYAAFSEGWAERRGQLAEVLNGWATELEKASTTMTEQDAELARRLSSPEQ